MKLEVVTVWDQKKYRPLKIGQTIWGNYDKKEKLNLGVSNWWNRIPKRVITLLRICRYKKSIVSMFILNELPHSLILTWLQFCLQIEKTMYATFFEKELECKIFRIHFSSEFIKSCSYLITLSANLFHMIPA